MPRAYSADLRERVVTDCEAGLGRAAAARRYRLGERTVYRWLVEARHDGRRRATPHAGGPRPRVEGPEDVLHELATGATPRDATLAEQAEAYRVRTGRRLSPSTLCRAFRRLGLTRKKDPARRRAGPRGDPGRAGGVRRTGARSRSEPAGVPR
jgi:transposase